MWLDNTHCSGLWRGSRCLPKLVIWRIKQTRLTYVLAFNRIMVPIEKNYMLTGASISGVRFQNDWNLRNRLWKEACEFVPSTSAKDDLAVSEHPLRLSLRVSTSSNETTIDSGRVGILWHSLSFITLCTNSPPKPFPCPPTRTLLRDKLMTREWRFESCPERERWIIPKCSAEAVGQIAMTMIT